MSPRTTPPMDEGVGLIELVVYLCLAILATAGVSMLFANGLSTDAATRARNAATGDSQVISASIQSSIRNASEFAVTGNLLRARVATGATGWRCEAWAVTPAGTLVHHSSATAIAVPANYSSWTVLANRARGTRGGGQAFIKSGRRLEARLEIAVQNAVAPITTDAVAQAAGEGTPTTCW